MNDLNNNIQSLIKALEAGMPTGAPGTLTQGASLQIQELEGEMQNVTFGTEHIKLQKAIASKKHKSTLVRFKRQLSYGELGGSAQWEGMVGQEETSDYVEDIMPMAYYSHLRRVTVQAQLVEAFDGVKAEDREADSAAQKIAADVEYDLFQGKAHFSNDGIFDGNPVAEAELPNMRGIDAQTRESDLLSNTQDLMFAEFGSSESVVLPAAGGILTQTLVEDVALRSRLNFGKAEKLMVDPVTLANYNKLIISSGSNVTQFATMGSALTSTGADLRSQTVSEGSVKMESSHFLRAKYRAKRARAGAPNAPTLASASGTAGSLAAGTYIYRVTAENEKGEGVYADITVAGVAANGDVTLTITPQGSLKAKFYNVYRTEAGASAETAKFIGRVAYQGTATVDFIDLGNKAPGFVNAYMIEADTWEIKELAPYSRMKLAQSDLSAPEAHFRFLCVVGYQPRKNALIDNLRGTI